VLTANQLKKLAKERLKDAKALLSRGRHDGAMYICGYAVELALKARICRHLRWQGFPETRKEFESYHSFKTHDLDVLLMLSGQDKRIKTNNLAEWSAVAAWDPEVRYKPVSSATKDDADGMIKAAQVLLNKLCP